MNKIFLVLILLIVFPCILLATFVVQALLGQKLLIEQEIRESYQALAHSTHTLICDRIKAKENIVNELLRKHPWMGKKTPVPTLNLPLNDQFFSFLYVFDENFAVVYPQERPRNLVPESLPWGNYSLLENNRFETAYFYEFQKCDLSAAIAEYQKIVAEVRTQKLEAVGYALVSIARCHLKIGDIEQALATYQHLTTLFQNRSDSQGLSFIIYAKSQIAEIYRRQFDHIAHYQTLLELLEFLIFNEYRIARATYDYHHQKVAAKIKHLEVDKRLDPSKKEVLRKEKQRIFREQQRILKREQEFHIAQKYLLPQLKLALEKDKENAQGYVAYSIDLKQYLAFYQEIPSGYVVYSIDLQYSIDKIIVPILKSQSGGKDILLTIMNRNFQSVIGEIPPQFFLIVRKQLSPIFSFWYIAVYLKNIRSLDELSRYRSQFTFLGVAIVIILLIIGVYIMITTFIREIRTARHKSDFVNSVTHELKTPLTAIKMFVETLLMGRTIGEEEQQECLQIIAVETDRLEKLIDRILGFAKMDQRKRVFHFAWEDLHSIVAENIEVLRKQIPEGENVDITIDIAPDFSKVYMDREAMGEVVANLFLNAYKYNDKTHKTIALSAKKNNANSITIAVADNGMGIPKREFHKIFKKFYRVESPSIRHIKGTGLGLALVSSIIRAHKGEIKVQSKINSGSKFIIILPQNSPNFSTRQH